MGDSKQRETKLCKHCQTEIPKKAKICPNCKKKQGTSGCLVAIGIVVILAIIGAIAGGGENNNSSSGADKKQEEQQQEEQIVYTEYTVDQMEDDLSSNALKASETYKDQYLEVTGRLDVIDSDGKYISLYPQSGYSLRSVQCYIKTDEQKEQVKSLSIGDTVTVRGKCTAVGEVMGYSLNIDSIN